MVRVTAKIIKIWLSQWSKSGFKARDGMVQNTPFSRNHISMLDMTKETAPETNIELLFRPASEGFLLGHLRNAIKFLGVVQNCRDLCHLVRRGPTHTSKDLR
jgi:hypothetical protein